MLELIPTLDSWAPEFPEVAMATVVRTWGSTPRPPGARLAIAPDGRMAGSVSGGCLEAEVVEQGLRTLRGEKPRVLHYGIADELGWTVGLACGGEVDIFVERLRWEPDDPLVAELRAAAERGEDAVLCTWIGGPEVGRRALLVGERLVGGGRPSELAALTAAASTRLRSSRAGVEAVGGEEVLLEPLGTAPEMVIVGAVDTGSSLCRLAQEVGYRVLVVDPRERFLTRERFPSADELIQEWPEAALARLRLGPRDAAVCLTHDPKFDDPTLLALLRSGVGYIGAIGSRKTQEARRERLLEMGAEPHSLSRIHGPVGLDLGGVTPAEQALAILAEAVAARYGRGGRPLQAG